MDDELEDLKPIYADFIIDKGIATQGNDGAYYHFSEVIRLLKMWDKLNKMK